MLNEIREYPAACPYCGEVIDLLVDCSVPQQRYIEDCNVCCRPMNVAVWVDSEGEVEVALSSDSD